MTEERVIYAWVLDGVSTIFVNDEGLDDTWALAQGFVSTHAGLQLPDSLPIRLHMRKLYPEQAGATIKVKDIDGTMAGLFGVGSRSTTDDLVTTLEAGDTAGASLFSRQVGPESIGSAGERRRFSCVPGFNVGLKHLGTNEAFVTDGTPAPVSAAPVLKNGRRFALYRVALVAGVWQDLTAAKRVWWGTQRGIGTQLMRVWSFTCEGPESWTGANLGTGNFQGPKRCIPLTTLVSDGWAGQTLLQATLDVVSLSNQLDVQHTYVFSSDAVGEDTALLTGAVTYDDIVAGVNSFIGGLVASATNGSAFDTNANDIDFEVAPGFDGITITWYRGESANTGDPFINNLSSLRYTARLRLAAHEKIWRALGYDVRVQNSKIDPVDEPEKYGQFGRLQDRPGYHEGTFYAANAKAMGGYENNDFIGLSQDDYSSGGSPRVWRPLYPGGAVVFDGVPGQEFQLDYIDELRLAGSLSRPIMADPADPTSPRVITDGVGDVTNQGLLVLEGPYRREQDADQVDPIAGFAFEVDRERREGRTIQVVRVCWRATSGLVATDSTALPRLVVYEWLDPRLFGFDYLPLDGGTWAGFREPPPGSESITARALVAWEYSSEGDRSAAILRRILATTGTATGWFADAGLTTPVYGLGAPSSFLDVGANDDGAALASDAEVAQLGLGIPASMIADAQVFDDVFSLAGDLGRCKVVSDGAADGAALIRALLAPAGVGLGFAGGKVTPFDAWAFPTPDEAVRTITPEDYALKPGQSVDRVSPQQQARLFAPIDLLELDARIEPVAGEYFRKVKRTSVDLGASYRAGSSVVEVVKADHLVAPHIPVVGNDWPKDVATRWHEAFVFWEAGHSVVLLTLRESVGLEIWPGEGVLVSDPWVVNTLGLYGVTAAAGRVIERVHSPKSSTVKLRVLVGADTDYRLWAPSAVVYRYDEQDLGPDFRLLCEDDGFGDRLAGSFDVDGFAEPVWSDEGDDAAVELFQFDAASWTRGTFGTIASVAGLVGASTMTLTGALTGAALFPDMFTVVVLREFASQTAEWAKNIYAPICDEAGEHSGGTKGSKWRGL